MTTFDAFGPTGLVLFAATAAAASLARWLLGRLANRGRLPWGTLIANVAGAFLLGAITGDDRWLIPDIEADIITIVAVAGLGAFTTVSTLTAEAFDQAGKRRIAALLAYLGVTVVLGIGAAWLGLVVGR